MPCNVKFSNAHMFNPKSDDHCIKFTATSDGDIFLIFAAIPKYHNTWYHIQIDPHGMAIYKVRIISYKTITAHDIIYT